jgi:hypothetical protein
MSLVLTDYHRQLIKKCHGDRDCVALGLAFDVTQGVKEAYETIKATGAPRYDRGAFVRAAKLILNENEKQQNPAG